MQRLRVLHFEDEPRDAFLVQRTLQHSGLDLDWTVISKAQDYLCAIERGELDLIVADQGIPSFNGQAALEAARAKCPHVPFIVLSGSDDPNIRAASLKEGATEFISKDHLEHLVLAIRRLQSK